VYVDTRAYVCMCRAKNTGHRVPDGIFIFHYCIKHFCTLRGGYASRASGRPTMRAPTGAHPVISTAFHGRIMGRARTIAGFRSNTRSPSASNPHRRYSSDTLYVGCKRDCIALASPIQVDQPRRLRRVGIGGGGGDYYITSRR